MKFWELNLFGWLVGWFIFNVPRQSCSVVQAVLELGGLLPLLYE